ncbi:MAG: hypothetical protein IJY42_01715, partial [Clostridia bacterium]|nr:hypothetical protein [Clostridia bacterium]
MHKQSNKESAARHDRMKMEKNILLNQKLEEHQLQTIRSLVPEDDPVVFAVVGEISNRANYSKTVLLATRSFLFTYDFKTEQCSEHYLFSDVEEIYNKRMYGNGIMRLRTKDGVLHDVFRFTFSVAALCDAVLTYVTDIRDGVSADEALGAMEAVYEKLLSVCPKCGRTLSAPGVPCIHCMKKGRLLKKLGGYLKPEAPVLIISVFLSILTTAITMVPPYLTKSLVDNILPNKDRQMLLVVVISLVCLHIVHYTVSGIRGYILRASGDKIIARMRVDVYEKAQHLPMRFYDKTSTGAVINRISSDTATLQSFMLTITREVVVQFFKLVGIVVVMLCINWKLTLFSLAPVPLVVIGSRIFRKKIAPFYHRIWRRSSAVTSVLTDTIPGIRVIK